MYGFFVVVIFLSTIKADSAKKNVCPTYSDYYTVNTNERCWYDVAADSDVPTIIRTYGYPVEVHKVLTLDKYILTMFRIPNDRLDAGARKDPVMLQHGFFHSGACFVGLGNISLGLTLANNGYDVWIGNFRGTSYSNKHTTFSPNQNQFWNFNVDHLGLNDVPAMLKYIVKKTGKEGHVIYIGHSLGTGALLQYGSRFPSEVKSMVKLSILIAPNGGMKNTNSLFFRIGVLFSDIMKVFSNIGMAKLFAPGGLIQVIANFCQTSPRFMETCVRIINLTNMGPEKETDASVYPVVFNQFPDGTSLKVYQQIADETIHEFRSYDYGKKNLFVYGQLTPPIYNISKVEVPVYLIYSKNDWCTTSKDAEILYSQLQDKAKMYGKYEIPDFNHNDFLYSKYAKSVVYDKILNLIDSVR